jgi:nitroreductase
MNITDLQSLVEQRRSIRGYDEKRAVDDATIRTILNCARWAPSGGNGQPWEFVIVRERATRYRIGDYYLKQIE